MTGAMTRIREGIRSNPALLAALLVALASGCAPAPAPVARPSAPARGTLVIAGTTDTHGWLLPYDYYRGVETENGLTRVAPLIDSVRAAHPGRTVLIDSGDLLQGNPLDFVFSRLGANDRHPVALAMNALHYDAAAIGNHEFNYGIDHLNAVGKQMEFPLLSANIFRPGTTEHAYQPYTIVERMVGGRPVRVGITAVTPPGVLLWDADNVRGRLDFRDIVQSVRPVVAEMKARGADVVVIAAHSGLEGSSYDTAATHVPVENASVAMARGVPGVDVIFMGHTHRELADTSIAGVLLLQARNWGTSLGVAELELAQSPDGKWAVVGKHGAIRRPDGKRSSAALTQLLTPAHEKARAYVAQPVGTSDVEWSARDARVRDTPIIDLINEVQRKVTGADLASSAAFSLEARIPSGSVTVADIAGLYPYDNTLKAIRISGRQLREYIEKTAEYYLPCPGGSCQRLTNPDFPGYNYDAVSGVDYAIDLTRPVGQRVVRLERNGRAVAPTDSFTLALNNYRASGAGGFNMLANAPVVYDRGEGIRELLIAEIQKRGAIVPGDFFKRNWEIVPAALAERAAAEQAALAGPAGELHGGDVGAARSSLPRLRVLGTNDFHGALEPTSPSFARGRQVGGAAALATYFAQSRTPGRATVLIDAGDVMQGTLVSNLSGGKASVDYYNQVGYAAAALGNHEFDWGIETLRERMRDARFAWLGANVYVKGTDTLPSWVKPTAMVTLPSCTAAGSPCDSVRVGIIGIATTSTPTTTRPSNVATLDFGDEAEAVTRWVPRLRAQGADFVIVTAHSGAFCAAPAYATECNGDIVDVARRVTAKPDLIVSGHTHSKINTVVNGITIVQAFTSGTAFSIVDLDRVSADSVAVRVVDQPTPYTDQVTPDTAVAALVQRHIEAVGPRMTEVVSFLQAPLTKTEGDYPLGNLIADAQRAATGTQVAIMNNGGIRVELLSGPLRYSDLFRLQPFANTLVTMQLTGDQLLGALEHGLASGSPDIHVSGLKVRYNPGAEKGKRVIEAVLDDGTRVTPNGRYTVTTNNFMHEGGSGFTMLAEGTNPVLTGIVDLDALVAYVRTLGQPARVPAGGRFVPQR
jgi:2',3'-cyclic-nucleotide 2'-phosphodiesterase / 3'-nucleotidase / 5'-nucleotidase